MKALHQLASNRNPIMFPPKEHWAFEVTLEEEANKRDPKGKDGRDTDRDVEETRRIKKYLLEYESRLKERTQKETESEIRY